MPETQARLSRPHRRYKDSYIAAVWEFIREDRSVNWGPDILESRFDEYLRVLRQAESEPMAGMVPATHYWLTRGDEFIGELNLRHELNDSLRRYGGHIGYTIRPSARRRGYGKLLCKLGIAEARSRGIGDILITCDDDNIGSCKIIEANGGVLLDKVDNGRAVLTRRYWIYAAG